MNDMRQMTKLGRKIEEGSFDVIDREVGPHDFDIKQWEVARRVIHATADFEYKHLMKFHSKAIENGIKALMEGCPIICDVQMIIAGLNKERLKAYGCETYSFISDEDVISIAKEKNTTRAIESMNKAHKLGLLDNSVVAIGNAPTALLEVVRLIKEEKARPALIVGVPVGFISAVESKEDVLDMYLDGIHHVPFILSRGRKGGSTIAVSIIHSLLLLSTKGIKQ